MKSFIERKIDVQMALDGDTFDGSNNTIKVSGLRCQATILTVSGTTGSCTAQLQMRISGMKNADMAKLSTLGFQYSLQKKNRIVVSAGDAVNGMGKVFDGAIVYCNVDYNSMPDVGVDIVASALADLQFNKIAGGSWRGDTSVESMVQGIAQASGMQFHNNGVTGILSNHAVGGCASDQIGDICGAAGVHWLPKDGTIHIWPKGGTINDTVTEVGTNTGMVGYPRYIQGGLDITSLFNPAIDCGQKVKITSSTPAPDAAQLRNILNTTANTPLEYERLTIAGANGTFYCGVVTHELSTQTPDGPWFTHMKLWDAPLMGQ